GMVAPHALPHRRELESPVGAFSNEAHARKRPQEAINAVLRDAGLSGDLATAPCAFRELIGDAEVYSGGDRLADPLADPQLGEEVTLSRPGGWLRSSFGQ